MLTEQQRKQNEKAIDRIVRSRKVRYDDATRPNMVAIPIEDLTSIGGTTRVVVEYPEQCRCGYPVDYPETYCPICLEQIHREFDVTGDDQPFSYFPDFDEEVA